MNIITVIFQILTLISPSFGMLGGIEVKPNDPLLSSFVGVYVRNKETRKASACTGTVISKNTVLTAAHCFNVVRGASNYEIILSGSNKPFQFLKDPLAPQFVTKTFHVFPDYYKSQTTIARASADVAVVRLDKGQFSSEFRPLPLVFSGVINQLPSAFQIYSVGEPSNGQTSVENHMFKKENFDLVPEESLKTYDPIGLFSKANSGIFLITHKSAKLQQGDSGGSALTNRHGIATIIGVLGGEYFSGETSLGFNFANLNDPTLNKWVRSKIN